MAVLYTNGSAIATIRDALGWSQTRLATEITAKQGVKVTVSTLSRIERDERQPSPKLRVAIANALCVPQRAILGPPVQAPSRRKDEPVEVAA